MTSEERRQREMRKKSKAILDAADEQEWGRRVKAAVSLKDPKIRATFTELWFAQEVENARGDAIKIEMLTAECCGLMRGWFVLVREPAPSQRNMLRLTNAGRDALGLTKAAKAAA